MNSIPSSASSCKRTIVFVIPTPATRERRSLGATHSLNAFPSPDRPHSDELRLAIVGLLFRVVALEARHAPGGLVAFTESCVMEALRLPELSLWHRFKAALLQEPFLIEPLSGARMVPGERFGFEEDDWWEVWIGPDGEDDQGESDA